MCGAVCSHSFSRFSTRVEGNLQSLSDSIAKVDLFERDLACTEAMTKVVDLATISVYLRSFKL